MSITTVFKRLNIKISPQDFFYNIENRGPLIFLDSSLPSPYSCFSYLGWDPLMVFSSYGDKNLFVSECKLDFMPGQHPLKSLDRLLKTVGEQREKNFFWAGNNKIKKIGKLGHLPLFKGGFMGYFAYELKNYIEKLPQTAADDYKMPLIYLIFPRKVAAFNHKNKQWNYIRIFENNNLGKIKDVIGQESKKLEEMINSRQSGYKMILEKYKGLDLKNSVMQSNFLKDNYKSVVNRAKEYIKQGDIYQVNLSQRFKYSANIEPKDFYYILRRINPAPFSALVKADDFYIASSSPERFLFNQNNHIQTRPIKGTRPRGKNAREDKRYKLQLKNSMKDRAELNMIVDLERNDLGKFCDYGSVKIMAHAVIEKYAQVMHSVSTVCGKVKENTSFVDILKATFPGGSISGAPKIRAMQIIDQLEPCQRGVYTGSIGYISLEGCFDFNIAIRTIIIKGKDYYYNVGGGIVADSDAESEYQETLDKGRAIEQAFDFFKIDCSGKRNLWP